jgi:hypothetical protein
MAILKTLAEMVNRDYMNYIHEGKPQWVFNDINDIIKNTLKNPMYPMMIQHYVSYQLHDAESIQAIIEFTEDDSILEVAAGQGFTSALLEASGFDPYKLVTTNEMSNTWNNETGHNYTDKIKDMDCLVALDTYPDHNVLMLLWPPRNSSLAYDCIKKFKGNKLIYGGQDRGGVTADDDFFDEIDKHWVLTHSMMVPSFNDIPSYLHFYTTGLGTPQTPTK